MKDEMEFENEILISASLVQAIFGITKLTRYRWQQRGLLPPPRRIAGRNFYNKAEVEARLAAGE